MKVQEIIKSELVEVLKDQYRNQSHTPEEVAEALLNGEKVFHYTGPKVEDDLWICHDTEECEAVVNGMRDQGYLIEEGDYEFIELTLEDVVEPTEMSQFKPTHQTVLDGKVVFLMESEEGFQSCNDWNWDCSSFFYREGTLFFKRQLYKMDIEKINFDEVYKTSSFSLKELLQAWPDMNYFEDQEEYFEEYLFYFERYEEGGEWSLCGKTGGFNEEAWAYPHDTFTDEDVCSVLD